MEGGGGDVYGAVYREERKSTALWLSAVCGQAGDQELHRESPTLCLYNISRLWLSIHSLHFLFGYSSCVKTTFAGIKNALGGKIFIHQW